MKSNLNFVPAVMLAVILTGLTIGCKQPRPQEPPPPTPAPTQSQLDDARTIATALEGYAVDYGAYPVATSIADLKAALEPEYIASLPAGDSLGEYNVRVTEDAYEIRNAGGAILLSR